jgi:hypothetical protein
MDGWDHIPRVVVAVGSDQDCNRNRVVFDGPMRRKQSAGILGLVFATVVSRNRMLKKGNITIYKAKFSVIGGGLVVLPLLSFGLTLPLIVEGAPVPLGQLLGLATFWLLGIALTVVPLGARLEVGEDYVKTYLFGFIRRLVQLERVAAAPA